MPRIISGLDFINHKGEFVRGLKTSRILESDDSLEGTFGLVENRAIPKYTYPIMEIQTFISLLAKAGFYRTAESVANILEETVKSNSLRNKVKRVRK